MFLVRMGGNEREKAGGSVRELELDIKIELELRDTDRMRTRMRFDILCVESGCSPAGLSCRFLLCAKKDFSFRAQRQFLLFAVLKLERVAISRIMAWLRGRPKADSVCHHQKQAHYMVLPQPAEQLFVQTAAETREDVMPRAET
jgi:hypothetical protein